LPGSGLTWKAGSSSGKSSSNPTSRAVDPSIVINGSGSSYLAMQGSGTRLLLEEVLSFLFLSGSMRWRRESSGCWRSSDSSRRSGKPPGNWNRRSGRKDSRPRWMSAIR